MSDHLFGRRGGFPFPHLPAPAVVTRASDPAEIELGSRAFGEFAAVAVYGADVRRQIGRVAAELRHAG